jgi:hypothetical protein
MKANKELLHALSETTEVAFMPRKLNGMREAMMRAPWRRWHVEIVQSVVMENDCLQLV